MHTVSMHTISLLWDHRKPNKIHEIKNITDGHFENFRRRDKKKFVKEFSQQKTNDLR